MKVLKRLDDLLPQQAHGGKRLCHLENLSIRYVVRDQKKESDEREFIYLIYETDITFFSLSCFKTIAIFSPSSSTINCSTNHPYSKKKKNERNKPQQKIIKWYTYTFSTSRIYSIHIISNYISWIFK